MSTAVRSGRTYEVFVNGLPIGLVGSTQYTLNRRRAVDYVKRFGPTAELRLIREVPVPAGYDLQGYIIRLRAAEAFDIIKGNTYAETGGLNHFSPLVQALGVDCFRSEIGRMGGRIAGAKCKENGLGLFSMTSEQRAAAGRKGGSAMAKSGRLSVIGSATRFQNGNRTGQTGGSGGGFPRGGKSSASHVRAHVRRGLTDLGCEWCCKSLGIAHVPLTPEQIRERRRAYDHAHSKKHHRPSKRDEGNAWIKLPVAERMRLYLSLNAHRRVSRKRT